MAKSSKKKKSGHTPDKSNKDENKAAQGATDGTETAPATLTSEVEDSLFYQVYQLNKMFREVADNTLNEFELSQRAYWLLECVRRDKGYSQSELGELLGVDRSDMVRLIDSLEEDNLLQRVRSTEDRRKQLITITPDGITVRHKIRHALTDAENDLLDELNDKQSNRLRKYTSKLTTGVSL
ncbi:MarR family winged helix-turn-helix transcriptional regulator [Corynebacterium parakroppenstedtii]|uniref:MarR family winged helix-turn-helix transcriptional regulator n=1 Tax=Corynebacterium parakroppenstedtii TaxID=2828363 RepID=UPI001FD61312|nr:MarR family transcriptional regulator [Corynebacterium parakroppenstedtii]